MMAGAVQCICILRLACEAGSLVIGIPCRLPLAFRPQATTIKVWAGQGRAMAGTASFRLFSFLDGKQCFAIFWLYCGLPPAV
jgi:hypothetical protein